MVGLGSFRLCLGLVFRVYLGRVMLGLLNLGLFRAIYGYLGLVYGGFKVC